MSSRLHAATEHAADVFGQLTDGALEGLTCTEAEALADVFRAIDRTDVAEIVLEEHAGQDDEGDQHYHLNANRETEED